MALGRISGPLLKDNLLRDGINLAFETDLLYIDVNNDRIGINTAAPTTDLDVNGTTKTTTLTVDTQANLAQLQFSSNTIRSSTDTIRFEAAAGQPTVYHSRLQVDDFQFTGNTISTTVSNSNIELRPNGAGTVNLVATTNITGNLNVTGNINATGNIRIDGNLTIGDNVLDEVVINASIKSDLIPETDNTYDLGTPSLRWKNVYVNNFYTDAFNTPSIDIGNLMFRDNEITTTTGQDLYIDGNGVGGVRLGNFRIVDNVITNVVSNAVSQILQSGTGYFKIAGTNAFIPPKGTNAQRPTALTAVLGMMRFNTENKAIEVWDGFAWSNPSGTGGSVTVSDAEDISAAFALMLG